jgi:outer membrane protein assembly factor BamB
MTFNFATHARVSSGKNPLANATVVVWVAILTVSGFLSACTTNPDKPKLAELPAVNSQISVKSAWSARVGVANTPLEMTVDSGMNESLSTITAASSDGSIASFDAATGRVLWRAQAGKSLSSGAGTEGDFAAVVADTNELVAFNKGSVSWRQKLAISSFTAPLLKNGKVYVLGSDRSLTAFDITNGNKMWSQKRSNEALSLRQSGVLLAVGDGLVASSSGKLTGINPLDGSVRWERAIATARGTNEIERLVDLVGRVSVNDDIVCARAYRVSVGCIDALRGNLLWTKPAVGLEGVQGDARTLFGTESDGKVVAWDRANGDKLWVNERLLGRTLSAPVVFNKYIAVGDSTGLVHLLSTTDGAPLSRLTTDGSAIVTAPVVVGMTLVVMTKNGSLFGFTAE